MENRTKGVLAVATVLALGLGAAFVILGPRSEPLRAEGPGVLWERLSVDEAMSRASDLEQRVVVRFEAEWCSSCRTLDEEILSTREGRDLLEGMVTVTYDFDAEQNRPLVERYVVLGLPTVLVLSPDGTQVGRIMGYESKAQWTESFLEAKTAEDPVPALRATRLADPDDPEAALRLGQALLVRGHPDEAEALLESVTWMVDPSHGEQSELGAEALFLLGRYYHRVRRDPRTARHVWRELAARFPATEWASGAWWWYAKAEADIGRPEVGLVGLRLRAAENPADTDAAEQLSEYVQEHGLTLPSLAGR